MDPYYEVIKFFHLFDFQAIVEPLKVVFIILFLLFFAAIVFLASTSSYLNLILWQDFMEFTTFRPFGLRKITKNWNKIIQKLESASESDHKVAVIEADEMFDNILKRMGFNGETLIDKLGQLTSATLSNLDQIKEAHAIRNNIVHNPDYQLNLDEAKKTLAIYEQAFRDLNTF